MYIHRGTFFCFLLFAFDAYLYSDSALYVSIPCAGMALLFLWASLTRTEPEEVHQEEELRKA